jgi:uroporphyrinogen decarboxylase
MKALLAALRGQAQKRQVCWLMRQAGRYLPEYRALRQEAGDFMTLALTPKMAAEVTLQPLRRFGMDGAILFSDILMVPYGLGLSVEFAAGEGPVVSPVKSGADVSRLEKALTGFVPGRLSPVFEALQLLESKVGEATLLGFAGAPWTVVTYMVEGGSSREFTKTFAMMRQKPKVFAQLMAVVEMATIEYLSAQIRAGAEAVQIFDSWASAVKDVDEFSRWCVEPTLRIAAALQERHPDAPVIAFPRGVAQVKLKQFGKASKGLVRGLGLGYDTPLEKCRTLLQDTGLCLQGNYAPDRLAGFTPAQVYDEVQAMCRVMQGYDGGYIANLGHGVVPGTPVENVAAFVRAVHDFKR